MRRINGQEKQRRKDDGSKRKSRTEARRQGKSEKPASRKKDHEDLNVSRTRGKEKLVKSRYSVFLTSVAVAALLWDYSLALAASAPSLGSAETFAVLGGTTVTNTGATIITGDLGVSPGSALTGFLAVDGGPGIVNGTIHAGDAVAAQAHSDAMTAYNALVAQACDFTHGNVEELGGQTLTPGVHCFPSSANLATAETLTLDFQGNANAVFVFKIVSTLVTVVDSRVVAIGGSQTCSGSNVFWAVGSSATIGTGTEFIGNIVAFTSITLAHGASLDGRTLAIGGAVTMDTNAATACGSGGGTFPPFPPECAINVTGGGQIPVPDPDDADPTAGGAGRATFGFNANLGESGSGARGSFNYLNRVTGLHVNGPVTSVEVIAVNPNGLPTTVRFSGTCRGAKRGGCSFSVTVEDHGEPGKRDQFGIAVTGALSELRSQRVISRGNIQFHKVRCDRQGSDDHDDDDR
jgi:hypothetical protein